jgi:ABC-type uncharacterized transport system permease subunit
MITAVELGLIYAIMALGVYLTFPADLLSEAVETYTK